MRDGMKIIFLDIDGVLNSLPYLRAYKTPKDATRMEHDKAMFNQENVARFNQLIADTGAKVVVSSSWRIGKSIDDMQELFDFVGVDCEVIGVTPKIQIDSCPRGLEIQRWMRDNESLYGNKYYLFRDYVILDDESDMLFSQRKNFFQTDMDCGLTDSMCYRVSNFLNN